MTQRQAGPNRRPGAVPRRAVGRGVRRRSAGLSPTRAGAALVALVSAAAIYGLAATSAFAWTRLEIRGDLVTPESTIRARLALEPGVNLVGLATEPLEARLAELPGIRSVEVAVALPDTLAVTLTERVAILDWTVGERHLLVDREGVVFGELPEDPPADLADLPDVIDTRVASASLGVGWTIDPVDLDAATRLASLRPSEVGSAAERLVVGVSDPNGFTVRTWPESWVAIFGFYGRSQRTTELIPGQVQLLGSLLLGRESLVATIVLADARDGTYIPKASPSAAP